MSRASSQKILLDTQVFIWLINESPRLGEQSRKLASSRQNQLAICTVSFFEMTIKASLGKLSWNPDVMVQLPTMGIDILPIEATALKKYQIFNEQNRDPFDNYLIASAITQKYQLLTADTKILATKTLSFAAIDATK